MGVGGGSVSINTNHRRVSRVDKCHGELVVHIHPCVVPSLHAVGRKGSPPHPSEGEQVLNNLSNNRL